MTLRQEQAGQEIAQKVVLAHTHHHHYLNRHEGLKKWLEKLKKSRSTQTQSSGIHLVLDATGHSQNLLVKRESEVKSFEPDEPVKTIGSKYLNLNGGGGVHNLGGKVHQEPLTVHKRDGALGRRQHCSLVKEIVWKGFHHHLRVLMCP